MSFLSELSFTVIYCVYLERVLRVTALRQTESYPVILPEGGATTREALYASISRPDTCGYSSNVCYMCEY